MGVVLIQTHLDPFKRLQLPSTFGILRLSTLRLLSSLLAHVGIDHDSIEDRNYRGYRHAAYACCTGEAHAN